MSVRRKIRPMLLRQIALFMVMFASLAVLAACATSQTAATAVSRDISWPLASSPGRVVWVRNITGPADIGSGSGFWQRLSEVVSGAESSPIIRPHGLLRSAAGALYLTDPGRGMVHCFDITKSTYSVIAPRDDAPLSSPIGITEDSAGRIYITDSMTASVYRYTPADGTLKLLLSKALERPTGIAFNPVNNMLYVADTLASQIVIVDLNGVVIRRIGALGEGSTGFNRPTDLAVDARGQIYITDSLNFRITVMTPEGQVINQFGSPGDAGGSFSRPKGIAVDSTGNIYVNDSLMDAVQVFDQSGELQLMFGRKGTEPGQFWMPSGLFVDRLDQVYVADTYNRRIQIFRYLPSDDDAHEGNGAGLFDKVLTTGR